MTVRPPLAYAWRSLWVGVLSVAVASAVRALLLGTLGTRTPWITFTPAVLAAAAAGGLGAGLVSTALSCAALAWGWRLFSAAPFLVAPADWLGFVVFAVVGVVISAFGEGMRRARARDLARAAEVAEREADLRGYFDSPLVGIAVTSPEKGWLQVNPALCSLLGYSREELQAKTWAEVTHPDDIAADVARFDRVVAGEVDSYTMDKRFIRKDGATVWASIYASCVRKPDRSIGHFVAVVADITERKAAEDALREREALLRAIADSTPDAIIATDLEGRLTFGNAAALRLTGKPPGEVLGKTPAEILGAGERARRLQEQDRDVMESRVSRTDDDETMGPGGPRRLLATRSPILGDDGRVRGVVGVAKDVTDIRKMEEQLAVASRLAAMGTLVAGVGHEINNPLAVAMANDGAAAQDLRELRHALSGSGPLDRKDLAGRVSEILASVEAALAGDQRVARIVKDLVALGRPSARRERVRLRDVVETAIRWLPAATGQQRTIEIEDHGAPDVQGRPAQLSQVVLNLLANAIRAGRQEGVPRIAVRIGPGHAGMARLEVVDDGVGIAPEHLGRIFDPFFSTRDPGQGSGLGLSICHAIVTEHGGSITATSEVGKGATFTVDLPAAA